MRGWMGEGGRQSGGREDGWAGRKGWREMQEWSIAEVRMEGWMKRVYKQIYGRVRVNGT